MKFKNTILCAILMSASGTVFSTQVTLTGPEEIYTGDTKICIYEGHGTSRTYEVARSEHCPFAKTFDLDEEESEEDE